MLKPESAAARAVLGRQTCRDASLDRREGVGRGGERVSMDQSGGGSMPPSGQQTPPPPPPQQGWQSTPQPPGPPPPAGGQPGGGMPSWTNNLTARGTMAGPAGVALADVPERAIAFVIDVIIIGIVGWIVSTVTTSVLGDNYLGFLGFNYRTPSLISALLAVVIMLAVTGAYFIYMYTRMGGATIGMKALKLSVRDATTGGPVSQNQAMTRWALVGAPLAIYWGLFGFGILALLAGLVLLIVEIALLVTTAQSPSRQGFHDVYAKTVVAKG